VAFGTTAIETRLGVPTARVAIASNPPVVTPTVAVPCPIPVARPPLVIEAVVNGTATQAAKVVRFCVLPSVYVPMTWYCSVVPKAIAAVDGVSERATKAGPPTVTAAELLWDPELAWITLVPRETPVTNPELLTVAEVDEDVQVAADVRS
jgi:hypothetical protein